MNKPKDNDRDQIDKIKKLETKLKYDVKNRDQIQFTLPFFFREILLIASVLDDSSLSLD